MDRLASLVEAFELWHAQHRAALPVSLRIRPAQGGLELTLEGVHPALGVTLDPTGVTVAVHWQGEVWDLLLSEDLAAVADGSMWRCSVCASTGKWSAFESLAALYRDHLFDPLAHSLRHSLHPATDLALYRTASGATWASLVTAATPQTAASRSQSCLCIVRALRAVERREPSRHCFDQTLELPQLRAAP